MSAIGFQYWIIWVRLIVGVSCLSHAAIGLVKVPAPGAVLPHKNTVVGVESRSNKDTVLKCSGSSATGLAHIEWSYFDTGLDSSAQSRISTYSEVGDGNEFPFESYVLHSELRLPYKASKGVYGCKITSNSGSQSRYFLVVESGLMMSLSSLNRFVVYTKSRSEGHPYHTLYTSPSRDGGLNSTLSISCWYPTSYPARSTYFTVTSSDDDEEDDTDDVATEIRFGGLHDNRYELANEEVKFYMLNSGSFPKIILRRVTLRMLVDSQRSYDVVECKAPAVGLHRVLTDTFILQPLRASPASALITPTLTPHPAIITSVGSSLMLTCALGNTRHPQHVGYRWFFEHFKLGGGQEELTAHSVHKRGGHLSLLTKTVKSVQQTGAYTCQIRLPVNINMTISTIVKVVDDFEGLPIFIHPNIQRVNASWGEAFNITCQAYVGIRGNLDIIRDGISGSWDKKTMKNIRKINSSFETVLTTTILLIERADWDNGGLYVCRAERGKQVKASMYIVSMRSDVPTLKITSTGEGVVTINDTTYVVDQSPLASLLCVPDISSPTDKVEWSIVSTNGTLVDPLDAIQHACNSNISTPEPCQELDISQWKRLTSLMTSQQKIVCTVHHRQGTTSVSHVVQPGAAPRVSFGPTWFELHPEVMFCFNATVSSAPPPVIKVFKTKDRQLHTSPVIVTMSVLDTGNTTQTAAIDGRQLLLTQTNKSMFTLVICGNSSLSMGAVETDAVLAELSTMAEVSNVFGRHTFHVSPSQKDWQLYQDALATRFTGKPALQDSGRIEGGMPKAQYYLLFLAILCPLAVTVAVVLVFWRLQRRKQQTAISLQSASQAEQALTLTSPVVSQRKMSWRSNTSSFAAGTEEEAAIAEITASDWYIPTEDLTFHDEIGHGAFGTIVLASLINYSASETPAVSVAVKGPRDPEGWLPKEKRELFHDIVKELAIMKMLGRCPHPNVIGFLGSTFDHHGRLSMVLEYCAHGNLLEFLRMRRACLSNSGLDRSDEHEEKKTRSPPSNSCFPSKDDILRPYEVYGFAKQIASGMEYLAKQNIVHRDLAARNVLIHESYSLRVSDFGLARPLHTASQYVRSNHRSVPVKWSAIESLYDGIYTCQSDVWSFGVLLWEIASLGCTPYAGVPLDSLYNTLNHGKRLEQPPGCLKNIYNTMRMCWLVEPSDRPTFAQLREQMTTRQEMCTHEEEMLEYLDLSPNTDSELSIPECVVFHSPIMSNNNLARQSTKLRQFLDVQAYQVASATNIAMQTAEKRCKDSHGGTEEVLVGHQRSVSAVVINSAADNSSYITSESSSLQDVHLTATKHVRSHSQPAITVNRV